MRSIRARLIMGAVIGTTVVVLLGGAVLYHAMSDRLHRAFDDGLRAQARFLASLVEFEGGRFEAELDYRALPEFARQQAPEYFEIRRVDGTLIENSPSLGDRELGFQHASTELLKNLQLPDGRPGRAAVVHARARAETDEDDERAEQPAALAPEVVVTVARGTEGLAAELAHLSRLLIVMALLVISLIIVVVWMIVSRGLTPLSGLSAQISTLGPHDLSARVILPGAPSELMPMVEVTNRLIERLETAIERERSFTGDVAHELRTPLAGLRSTLEVALSRERSPEEARRVLSDCLGITAGMQTMAGNLLALARLDRRQIRVQVQAVEVGPLMQGCWRTLDEQARHRSLRVTWEVSSELTAETDPDLLAQVLTSLLDNAVTHADDGGEIQIAARDGGGQLELNVRNTGSRLASSDVRRACEAFWRGDAARSGAGHHAGLGLSIARRVTELLGGTLTITSEWGGWFQAHLTLPLCGVASSQDNSAAMA